MARMEREPGLRFEATSLPGHLVHVMVRGRVRQECNGRPYDLGARDAIWYHEDELVVGEVVEPWTFYSVNFIAPSLPPPELSERQLRPRWPAALRACERLHQAWTGADDVGTHRALAVHAALHDLLACLQPRRQSVRIDDRARLWWWLEGEVRARLRERFDLAALAALSGASAATIDRSCRHATGVSPMRRIKRLRLSLARGLLARRDLSIGAIAATVGYGRIHEFSRDYRAAFGAPPSHQRGLPGSDYNVR